MSKKILKIPEVIRGRMSEKSFNIPKR
jgi:hypothetical protein